MNEECRKYVIPFLLASMISLSTGALMAYGKIVTHTEKIATLEEVVHEIKTDVKEILKELRGRKF